MGRQGSAMAMHGLQRIDGIAMARQGSALPRQSTGQLCYGTARQSSAVAGQSTDTTITARRLSEARQEPRFAPRRHSTDATCTATAWTGYAPQGRCSEPQSCGTALDSLARYRHGKGSWGNALPRHSAALIATQNIAEDEHWVARLGHSVGWLSIGRASHRTALHSEG